MQAAPCVAPHRMLLTLLSALPAYLEHNRITSQHHHWYQHTACECRMLLHLNTMSPLLPPPPPAPQHPLTSCYYPWSQHTVCLYRMLLHLNITSPLLPPPLPPSPHSSPPTPQHPLASTPFGTRTHTARVRRMLLHLRTTAPLLPPPPFAPQHPLTSDYHSWYQHSLPVQDVAPPPLPVAHHLLHPGVLRLQDV